MKWPNQPIAPNPAKTVRFQIDYHICRVGDRRCWSRMSTPTRFSSTGWRWALITSQLLVVTFCVMDRILIAEAGHRAHFATAPSLIVGILVFPALLFLLFGSPFLVRLLGPVAITGWCVGAAALVFSHGL